jgi:hypothetical protein
MGQKSIVNTLRSLNQTSFSNNNIKLNFLEIALIKSLKLLFKLKKIETSKITISNLNNKIQINFSIFYCTQRIVRFKKFKNVYYHETKFQINKLFKKIIKFLKVSILEIKIININKLINKDLIRKMFPIYKKYMNNLFDKKFYMCVDITKITILFLLNKIDNNIFLNSIAKIFSTIHKKNHLRFFKLISTVFNFLVSNHQNNNKILGLKLLVSGKLRGKTIASNQVVIYGSIPIQTLNKDISFEKIHVYTTYGVFGFKLWTHRNII